MAKQPEMNGGSAAQKKRMREEIPAKLYLFKTGWTSFPQFRLENRKKERKLTECIVIWGFENSNYSYDMHSAMKPSKEDD